MMQSKSRAEGRFRRGLTVVLGLSLAPAAIAQERRITKAVEDHDRAVLSGHMNPQARPENDRGRVDPSLQLTYVTLQFAPSASQQAELDKLLAEQQDESSPNYHRWLTPEQYAQRFGVSQDDMDTIATWLKGHGFRIAAVARGRSWIAVSGDAATFEKAFGTEIHRYAVRGETHFANATEPSVPAAFAGVVRAIRGLNDFKMKPAKRLKTSAVLRNGVEPRFTDSSGNTFLTPGDFATIYDVTPLYNEGVTGAGQSLVVGGQTQIRLSDIHAFRTSYGLPANDPELLLVPGAKDPGISSGDLDEADLDIEWSGGVAKNAKVIFVYSDDVGISVQYAIDSNLAPVVSQSYGLCEQETGRSDAVFMRTMAQQANAQGITWLSASGDAGAADCSDSQNPGLSVDLPAAVPEVVAVGGTEFLEGSGQYWNPLNFANGTSAVSYIPETSWNDSVADGSPSASGGGKSLFFSKPSWQSGPGVPRDNGRDVPDIALSGSADHDGYFVFTGGKLQVYGGTSVSVQAFAGLVTLLNQYLIWSGEQGAPGVGNMNAKLYSLAQTAPSAFHDITTGDNIVTTPCSPPSSTCSNQAVGYHAGKGYDLVTGLGSVDANKFVTAWHSGKLNSIPATTSMTLLGSVSALGTADTVYLIAEVTGANGVTPAGSVQFAAGGSSLGSVTLAGSGGIATATLGVTGSQLPQGSSTVTAAYNEGSSGRVSASVTLSVSTASNTQPAPSIDGIANGASFQHAYAPGMLLSVFGTELAPSTVFASSVPLPLSAAGVAVTVDGIAAPLYYVSQQQLNIQIPYEINVNGPQVTLSVNNNGLVTTFPLTLTAVAPGIFTDTSRSVVPHASGARGHAVTLFLTGAGLVAPQIATGAAPQPGTLLTQLPKPAQGVTVTVGGVPATVEFVGIPWGLVGVTQVNFTVPTGIADGAQPVIVSVGGIVSAPANLTVTD